MAKPAEAILGHVSLNRFAVCGCSDVHVCFVLGLFGVTDGPLSMHVERARPATRGGGNWPALRAVEEDREYRSLMPTELGFEADGGVAPEWLLPSPLHLSIRQSIQIGVLYGYQPSV